MTYSNIKHILKLHGFNVKEVMRRKDTKSEPLLIALEVYCAPNEKNEMGERLNDILGEGCLVNWMGNEGFFLIKIRKEVNAD